MSKILNKQNIIILLVLAMLLALVIVAPINVAYAGSGIDTNGKYIVPITKDLKMGGDNFSDSVVVERLDDNYYMTFSVLDPSMVSNLTLVLGDDIIGEVVWVENGQEKHMYTLSREALGKTLHFKAFVNAMKADIEFNISLNLSGATKQGDELDDRGERPGRFIPTIITDAGNTVMEKGSMYIVSSAVAKISNTRVEVETKAYYMQSGVKTEVEIVDDKIKLANVGEYRIVYRAESDKYLTSFGNNTFNELEIIVKSEVGATSLARVENIGDNKVLKDGTSVQAGLVKKDSDVYKKAQAQMKKIADNFEVISVTLYDEEGNEPTLSGNIYLDLNANNMYDRTKVQVYYLASDGTISEVPVDPYGRYVRVTTNKVGNFIICVPGVAFHMPMWGYALITVFAVIILVVIIVVPIVVTKKKKKKAMEQEKKVEDENIEQ